MDVRLVFAVGLLVLAQSFALPKVHIPNDVGLPADPNQYPWMVSLQKKHQHYCGGFLVSIDENAKQSDIVITAAHCLSNDILFDFLELCQVTGGNPTPKLNFKDVDRYYEKMDHYQVVAGHHRKSDKVEVKLEEGVERRPLSRMEMFPKYGLDCSNPKVHDIAILKLESPLIFTKNIQPIRLPSRDAKELEDGTQCTVAGWGGVDDRPGGDSVSAAALRHLNVSIVPITKCKEQWEKATKILKENFTMDPIFEYCVNPGREVDSTCGGDSGSPFFCKENTHWVARGVVSRSYPGCKGAERWAPPAVFAKIEPHLEWIHEKIGDWS